MVNYTSQGTGAGVSGITISNCTFMNGANVQFAGSQQYGVGQYAMSAGGYRSNLWGKNRDMDYWTARAAGEVPDPERRAMALLASECDEERFSLYCHIGSIAALGNMTRHVYIVRRYCSTMEMHDGRHIQDWCVMTRDRHLIPETDHVLALKSLIEGEELGYRATGNRTRWGTEGRHQDPYRTGFLPEGGKEAENEMIADFETLPNLMENMKYNMWLNYHGAIERAKQQLGDQIPVRNVSHEMDAELAVLRQRRMALPV